MSSLTGHWNFLHKSVLEPIIQSHQNGIDKLQQLSEDRIIRHAILTFPGKYVTNRLIIRENLHPNGQPQFKALAVRDGMRALQARMGGIHKSISNIRVS
jgi:hypothetical protein